MPWRPHDGDGAGAFADGAARKAVTPPTARAEGEAVRLALYFPGISKRFSRIPEHMEKGREK